MDPVVWAIEKTDPSGHEADVASLSAVTAIQQIVASAAATYFVITTAADGLVQIGDFNALLYGYSRPVDNLFARAQARAIAQDRVKIKRKNAIIGETFYYRVLRAQVEHPGALVFDLPTPSGIHGPGTMELNRTWIRTMMFLRYNIIDIGFDTDRGTIGDVNDPRRGDFYLMELEETRFYPFKTFEQYPPNSQIGLR